MKDLFSLLKLYKVLSFHCLIHTEYKFADMLRALFIPQKVSVSLSWFPERKSLIIERISFIIEHTKDDVHLLQ